ncbi:MAG TPA: hypothetical protein VK420_20885 [Longimicrobium sp.]|nr:hypothetical protein [Longimicrobium sp.]
MKKTIVAVVVGLLFACGGGMPEAQLPEAEGELQTGSTQQAVLTCLEVPPMPEVPSQPRELDERSAQSSFLTSTTVRSAYLIAYPDPGSPNTRFHAIAYDVAARQTLFYVGGPKHLLRDVAKQFAVDAVNIATGTSPLPDYTWGMGGYVIGPTPTGPGPGTHDPMSAWKNAVGVHAALH